VFLEISQKERDAGHGWRSLVLVIETSGSAGKSRVRERRATGRGGAAARGGRWEEGIKEAETGEKRREKKLLNMNE
jgi:hypothetical protein